MMELVSWDDDNSQYIYIIYGKFKFMFQTTKDFSIGNHIPNMVDHEKAIKPPIRLNQFILIHVLCAWNVENNMNETANIRLRSCGSQDLNNQRKIMTQKI